MITRIEKIDKRLFFLLFLSAVINSSPFIKQFSSYNFLNGNKIQYFEKRLDFFGIKK